MTLVLILLIIGIVYILTILYNLQTGQKLVSRQLEKLTKEIQNLKHSGLPATGNIESSPISQPTEVEVLSNLKEEFLDEKIIEEEPAADEKTIQTPAPIFETEPLSELSKTPKKKTINLEEYIGGNLANKFGIGILVLGIGFFVKYAIDQDWINEIARVGIGFLCGLILLGIAHRLRKKYHTFSSVLVGGGLAILYVSIAFAYHQYELISSTVAFFSMLVVTILAVVLSIYYDRQEIAIIAILGGFCTPFLASSGNDNYSALFIYLALMCAGMTVLAWYRRWLYVNIVSMLGTAFIFLGWLLSRLVFSPYAFPHQMAMLFCIIFFLLFLAMHLANYLRTQNRLTAFEFGLVLFTQVFFYLSGSAIALEFSWPHTHALFTGCAAVFNIGLGTYLLKKSTAHSTLAWLLITVGIIEVTAYGFIQLEGNAIVIFWAAQAAILFGLSQKLSSKLLLRSSYFLYVLTILSLCLLWLDKYLFNTELPIIVNSAFSTTVVVSLSIAARAWLRIRDQSEEAGRVISANWKYDYFAQLALAVLLLGGLFETSFQTYQILKLHNSNFLYIKLYILLVLVLLAKLYPQSMSLTRLSLIVGCFIYLLFADTIPVLQRFLIINHKSYHMLAHLPASILLLYLVYRFLSKMSAQQLRQTESGHFYIVSIGIFLLLFFSADLYLINQALFHGNNRGNFNWENLYYRAQLSILWGLIGFAYIWLGFRYKMKNVRILALFVLGATLIKLFFYDIANVSAAGKIISFILLGVLLLMVSFMYQRLKLLLLQKDEEEGKS